MTPIAAQTVRELIESTKEVLRIAHRKTDAFDRAYTALTAAEALLAREAKEQRKLQERTYLQNMNRMETEDPFNK